MSLSRSLSLSLSLARSAPLVRRVFDAALTKAWVANASMERRERYPHWSGVKWEQPWWDRCAGCSEF